MTLHNQCPYQVSTSYTFQFLRNSPDKILWVKVTTASLKVKSWSHHCIAHLQPLSNVPTKCQLPTPYRFQDIARTRFSNSRSLQQGQRSNQDHSMMLHTYNPNLCPYQVSTYSPHTLPTPCGSKNLLKLFYLVSSIFLLR